jgi:parvulin-like peptidyl-prolyl isomerase
VNLPFAVYYPRGMLEGMRRQGASIFIYLIFCLLIAIFIINFRPGQSRQDDGGCTGAANLVVNVDGADVSQTAYKVVYSAQPFLYRQMPPGKQRTYYAIDTLIRRELLAQAAEARGLRIDDATVQREIQHGVFFYAGQRLEPAFLYETSSDGEKFYTAAALNRWIGELNLVSKNSYQDEQARAMLAAMMQELLEGSVQVSRDEALNEYLFENETVTYDAVAFKPADYRTAIKLTDADVARFVGGHEDEVKARFKQDERLYKDVHQIQLREIFIAKKDDEKIDDLKAKLEAARAAIASGKQSFADAAKQLASDASAKDNGGELGWRPIKAPSLGDKAVDDAVKELKAGDLTPVLTSDHGAYLAQVENRREGDLTYDQVKLEVARDVARDVWSKEAAKRAALAALADARAGKAKNLAEMYEMERPSRGKAATAASTCSS